MVSREVRSSCCEDLEDDDGAAHVAVTFVRNPAIFDDVGGVYPWRALLARLNELYQL